MSEFSKGVDRRTVLGGLGALAVGGGGAFAASGHNTAQIIFKGVKDD